MKKKIISSILAVAMIATMAIPSVFAASSDVAGDSKKVTKITAEKDVFEIPVNEPTDFSEKISVFENETKLVLDQQHIRYKLEGVSGDYGDFNIKGSKVTPKTVGATAKLTVYDNYNQSNTNARVTVTLKAVAAANGLRAETFSFADPYKKLPITAANNSAYSETQSLKIKSHPNGSWFPRAGHNEGDVARLNAAMTTVLDDIAWAMFGGSSVNGANIVYAAATNGKTAGFNVAAVKAVYNVNFAGITAGTIKQVFGQDLGVAGAGIAFITDDTATAAAVKTALEATPMAADFIFEIDGTTDTQINATAKVAGADSSKSMHMQGITGTGIVDLADGVVVEDVRGLNASKEGIAAVYTANFATLTAGTTTLVFGQPVNVAFRTDLATTLGDVVTALNATSMASNFTFAATASTVVATAKTLGVDSNRGTHMTPIGVSGAAGLASSLISETVAGRNAATGGVEYATVTYDFTNAVALAPRDIINIGGLTAVVPDNLQRDVLTQLDTWLTNKSGTPIIGEGETYKRVGYKIIVTQKQDGVGAAWDAGTPTAVTADFTAAERETSFPTKGAVATTVPFNYHKTNFPDVAFNWEYNADNKNEIDIKIDYSVLETLPTAMVMDVNKSINSRKMVRLDGENDQFNANVNLQAVVALRATGVQIEKAAYDVMVGEKVPFNFNYYPTNANVGLDAKRDTRPLTVTGSAYQYAVVDGDKILGVNSNTPGQARAVVVLTGTDRNPINNTNLGDSTAMVTVKPAVYKPQGSGDFTSKISTTALEVEAGKIAPVTISNLPTGVTVKWTHKDDGTIGLNKNEGPAVVVTGKKVGTNVLTASLSNGEKFDVAVTVKAATAVAPAPGTGNGGSTNVPQTGDSLFANLF